MPYQVVLDKVVLNKLSGCRILEGLQLLLRLLSVIKAKAVASLEIYCNDRICKGLEIHGKDFQRHIVIVELGVAKGDVDIKGKKVSVLEKVSLVNIGGFLQLAAVEKRKSNNNYICICINNNLKTRNEPNSLSRGGLDLEMTAEIVHRR